MNRRQLVMLSGAVVAAGQGYGQTAQPAPGSHSKALVKLGRTKSTYKIPRTEAKKTKYLNSLTAALALTPDQQQQVQAIFSGAVAARATLRAGLKTAHRNLSEAVRNDNSAGIAEMSAAIGELRTRVTTAGANANAAMYRILTPDQRARLTQFQS